MASANDKTWKNQNILPWFDEGWIKQKLNNIFTFYLFWTKPRPKGDFFSFPFSKDTKWTKGNMYFLKPVNHDIRTFSKPHLSQTSISYLWSLSSKLGPRQICFNSSERQYECALQVPLSRLHCGGGFCGPLLGLVLCILSSSLCVSVFCLSAFFFPSLYYSLSVTFLPLPPHPSEMLAI